MILASLLAGCLIQTELYEARRALLVDEDGDGFNQLEGDCDDGDGAVAPGLADDDCDGVDDDCDGAADQMAAADLYHRDGDGDGFGDPDASLAACSPPDGYTLDGGDCDDADAAINPDAPEVCDGVDNDCSPAPLPAGSRSLDEFLLAQSEDPSSRLGAAVAGVGDWSGDGVGDVAAGAPEHGEGAGLVRLWYGPVAKGGEGTDIPSEGAGTGASLSAAGGYALFGAPGESRAVLSAPALGFDLVIFGEGAIGEAVLLTEGLLAGVQRNLVIAAQPDGAEAWRIYVFPELSIDLGREDWDIFADLLGPDPDPPGLLAADVDGDGQQDLLVGSGDLTYLFFGPLEGALSYPHASVNGDAASRAGAALAWAPEAGVLAVGAPGDDAVYLHAGLAPGSYADIDGDAAAILRGAAGTGAALAAADLDGDGASDLVIGAPDAGVVYVLRGPLPQEPGGALEIDLEEEADLRLAGPKASLAGASVAFAAGATPGACGDVLVGAPGSAAVYLVPGGE